ncbi:MAG: hypothetical protein KAH84_10220 [Thiomargarita sp.]|nr:hypothetical protein [Thiomargarita sp.]
MSIIVSLGLLILTIVKDRTYHSTPDYKPDDNKTINTLVIYFSRSGHTKNIAKIIAYRFQADLVEITAKAYSLDFEGWNNAITDAENKNAAVIEPETVDMSNYDLIFLGSPIWLFRPSPPIWTFVEKNQFQGKKVVLFNTFKSHFKAEAIETFKALVEKQGGQFIDHIYVRRGRVYYQKNDQTILEEINTQLDQKEQQWLDLID